MRRFLRHEVDTITLVERLQQQLEVAKTHLQGGGSPVRTFSVDFFLKPFSQFGTEKFVKGDILSWRTNAILTESIQSSFVSKCLRRFFMIQVGSGLDTTKGDIVQELYQSCHLGTQQDFPSVWFNSCNGSKCTSSDLESYDFSHWCATVVFKRQHQHTE